MRLYLGSILTLATLIACAPAPNRAMMAHLPEGGSGGGDQTHLTGGHNREGLAYTTTSNSAAETMNRLKQVIPETAANIDLAMHNEIEIRFLDESNNVTDTLATANRLWILIHLHNDQGVQTETLEFTLEARDIKFGSHDELPLTPVARSQAAKYQASLACEDHFCSSMLVRFSIKAEAEPVPVQPTTPSTPPPAASGARQAAPAPAKPPAASVTPPSGNSGTAPALARAAEAATLVTWADASVVFLIPAPVEAQMNSGSLSRYPELSYIKDNYTSVKFMRARRQEQARGKSQVSLKIPLQTGELCLEVEVLETNPHPSSIRLTCGTNFFNRAELLGNSQNGHLALKLFHASGNFHLILDINLDPGSQEPQVTAVPPPPSRQISDEQVIHSVNDNAVIKVDFTGHPRTLEMERLLLSEVRTPEQQALVDRAKRKWQGLAGTAALTSFALSAEANSPQVKTEFAQKDLPLDLMLLTLQESRSYWVLGTVEVGRPVPPKDPKDCAVGPWQILYGTAASIIQKSPELKDLSVTAPIVTGESKKSCQGGTVFKQAHDARADFTQGSRIASIYLASLATTFKDALGKNQTVVDPRFLVAAYNAGPGRVSGSLFTTVARETRNTKMIPSSEAAQIIYSAKNGATSSFQRLFDLAEVYPNFWTLLKLNALPTETADYVLAWMALREANQNSSSAQLGQSERVLQ